MVDIWKNVAASILFILILNTALFVQSDVGKSCDDSNFPCDNGECISPIFWCDSIEDCSDASDEAYCKNSTDQNGNPNKCSDKFFKCNDGTCIPLIGRCDGLRSCADDSDEIDCPAIVKSTGLYSRPEKISADSYRHLNFAHQYKKALLWLLSQRNDKLGWGEETPRVLTALHQTDFWLFEKRKEVKSLLLKQLEVQLSLAMLKNVTISMTDSELALYINALLASCEDPANFYGKNLVKNLRHMVNSAQSNGRFVNPAVYLTLAINNATTNNDFLKLDDVFSSEDIAIKRLDFQALAMLAVSSAFETNSVSIQMYEDFQTKFLQTLNSRNSPGNIYEAALTMHVLIQLKLNETESNIPKFMDFILRKQQIDGSFESILAAYLVLPVLSGRNLLQIGKQCGPRPQTDITPIEVLKSPEHQNNSVKYILSIGNPAEISQILQIQVQEGINLLDVMKMAQDISPQYRFLLNENQEFPEVYSIGGIPNDAEKGMIWRLYVTTSVNSSDVNENHMTPYAGNIKDIFPKEEDEILFWYKPT